MTELNKPILAPILPVNWTMSIRSYERFYRNHGESRNTAKTATISGLTRAWAFRTPAQSRPAVCRFKGAKHFDPPISLSVGSARSERE